MEFIAELKRRNVVKMGLLYIVGSWLVMQVADVMGEVLSLPDWTLRFVFLVAALGFPIALIFAWVFEMTPEGLKRERDVPRDSSITRVTGKKLDLVIGVLLLVAITLLATDMLLGRQSAPEKTVVASSKAQDATNQTAALESSQEPIQKNSESKEPLPGAPAMSIAVLPFINMSSDPENEYFADGLSEELLNVLAQIQDFKVAGRTSSFSFKGKNQDLRLIGQTLNVGTVLEGSVRKSGNQVRITAQLINVADGYHLWSETYDRKLDDIFSIQDDIARQVVGALKKTLLAKHDQSVLDKRPTDNLEAYQLYLRGRHQIAKRSKEGLELALAAFREATALDPEFARAWTGVADSLSLLASYNYQPASRIREEAEQAIAQAQALDPELDEAYASKGLLLSQLGGSQNEIIALYRKALVLNPNNVMAHMWLGGQLWAVDANEALEHYRRAYALDPLAQIVLLNLANQLALEGNTVEARKYADELLQLDPGWPGAQRVLASTAFIEADSYSWVTFNLKALELEPNSSNTLSDLSAGFLALGDLDMADKFIQLSLASNPDDALAISAHASLLARRGQPESGLALIFELLARQPSDKKTLVEAINLEASLGSAEKTLGLCQRHWGSERAPDELSFDQLMEMGEACIYALRITGDANHARTLYNSGQAILESISRGVPEWAIHVLKARLAAAAGDRETALRSFAGLENKPVPPNLIFPMPPWLLSYVDDPQFKPLFDGMRRNNDALYAKLTADGLTSGNRIAL